MHGRPVAVAALFSVLAAIGAGQQPPAPAPTAAEQRPVFRGGTHFVRVDAYPARDGRIIEGLTADDFEILEDGKPQKIESFDFIKYETWTPDAGRRDPASQREGFDLAADPRYRVFVVFVDLSLIGGNGTPDLHHVQQPLITFLERILGPQDLFGFLTSRHSPRDLVLVQRTTAAVEDITALWQRVVLDRDEADELDVCGREYASVLAQLKRRFRADATYSALEALIAQLGSIREERKNIVLVSNALEASPSDTSILERRGPGIPRIGAAGGRVGTGDRPPGAGDPSSTPVRDNFCASEAQRLAQMDFERRFRSLMDAGRRANVGFYPITPAGLQSPLPVPTGRTVDEILAPLHEVIAANDRLKTLASETGGVAIVDSNDLDGGFRRIADDLGAYYLLGYYTTNTKWDGGVRSIKVRLRPGGAPVRARRQYRAPTQQEMNALAAGTAPGANRGGSLKSPPAATGPSQVAAAVAALENSITYSERGGSVGPARAPGALVDSPGGLSPPSRAAAARRDSAVRTKRPAAV